MIIDIPYGTHPTSDAMAILLAELLAATATTKERQSGFWIPITSRHWREVLGSRYKQTIAEAVALGLIEINDRYSVGRFSKSYRLADRFRRPKTQNYVLRKAHSWPSFTRIDASDVVGLMLVDQFKRVQLLESPNGWDGYCAYQIRKGLFYATRCQYGRFHSTFTGLRRVVRSQLLIDGERPCELDVANCQPLILGLLTINQTRNKQTTNITTTNITTTNNTTTNNHNYSICGANFIDQSIKNYISVCESGELYEYLERLCLGKLTLRNCIPPNRWHRHASDRRLTRKDVKRQFLVMLFADVTTTKRMPLYDVVATEWPTIADFVLDAKRDCYQNLARECQRLESRIMIDGSVARLLGSSQIPIITIHDAILTTAAHLPAAKAEIIAEFRKLGVTPKVRATQY